MNVLKILNFIKENYNIVFIPVINEDYLYGEGFFMNKSAPHKLPKRDYESFVSNEDTFIFNLKMDYIKAFDTKIYNVVDKGTRGFGHFKIINFKEYESMDVYRRGKRSLKLKKINNALQS